MGKSTKTKIYSSNNEKGTAIPKNDIDDFIKLLKDNKFDRYADFFTLQ